MTIEELDAELAAATASLERLRESTIAEFTALADAETNPYTKAFLLTQLEHFRVIGRCQCGSGAAAA